MKIVVLTLFPEFFAGPLEASVLGRAIERGVLDVVCVQIRDFANDRHNTVDDTPYGGGAGMVMRATELAAATEYARSLAPTAPVLLMSPQGATFRQSGARSLADHDALILVCGRYEGVDERYVDAYVDAEVSIGDFVLTGGEYAALCMIDAVDRLLPGALGNDASTDEESFSSGLLEYPQFTRPARFEDRDVPPVLVSGDHGRVERWRHRVSLERTRVRRPDLWATRTLTTEEQAILDDPSLEPEEWLVEPRKLPGSG